MVAGKWEQLNAYPRTRDAVVTVTWLLIGLAALQFAGVRLWADFAPFSTDGTAYMVALFAIAAVALLRSTRPFLALGLGASIAAVDLAFGGSLGVVLILSDLVYAAVKYGSDRGLRIALWTALVAAALLAAGLLVVSPRSPTVPTVALQFALIIFVSAAWGWAVRSERARTRATLVQAHTQQTSEMRERIAHDLHDLVANHIAVAGLHIEAAKLRLERETSAPDPDRSAGQSVARPGTAAGSAAGSAAIVTSLDRAKQGADAAHRELRALIEVLTATIDLDRAGLDALEYSGTYDTRATVTPPEAAAEITEALDGLGALLPDGRALLWNDRAIERMPSMLAGEPAATQTAVLRALRELIANAAKHGSGDVSVNVEAEEASSRVSVSNRVLAGGAEARGTRLGLRSAAMILGMVGGQLEGGAAGEGPSERANTWIATITLPRPRTHRPRQPKPTPRTPRGKHDRYDPHLGGRRPRGRQKRRDRNPQRRPTVRGRR